MKHDEQTEVESAPDPKNLDLVENAKGHVDRTHHQEANRQLRAIHKEVRENLRGLRNRVVSEHVAAIGLDPGLGLGRALLNEYKGKAAFDDVAAYAQQEFSYEQTHNEELPESVRATNRFDLLMQSSTPVDYHGEPTLGEQAQHRVDANDPEATREDAMRSISEKTNQFGSDFYGGT